MTGMDDKVTSIVVIVDVVVVFTVNVVVVVFVDCVIL